MEKKIIFATGNAGKMREIRAILSDLGLPVLSMKEAGVDLDIVEDGKTFAENAKIKAMAVWKQTGGIVLADDSGLAVDYIGGEPGVYSARYMGEDTSYEIKNRNIIERLSGAEGKERSARFVCNIAAVLEDGRVIQREAYMEGLIAKEPAGNGGFGYDPILYLPEFGKTSAELTMEEKNQISHRGKALEAMKMKILIVSDTHRKDENLKWVIRKTKPFDMLIHLGDAEGSEYEIMKWVDKDCDLEMIMGNNDFFSQLEREKEIMIGKYKVLLTHGHYYNVSTGPAYLKQEARERGFDIVMFGHTHRPYFDIDKSGEKELITLNPGSLSYPRQEGHRPSYMLMKIDDNGEARFEQHYL